jgi:DNA-binding MarR family transcriptional regulator
MSADGPPLARLFAIAYRALIDGLHDRLRERGWDDVRPAYGFALLAASAGPVTATDLANLTGTTKQAASKLVDAMEVSGLLRRTAGAADGRQRPAVLTTRGRRLLATVEEIYGELEAEWAAHIGAVAVERLRADLVAVLTGTHGGSLPPVRPTW